MRTWSKLFLVAVFTAVVFAQDRDEYKPAPLPLITVVGFGGPEGDAVAEALLLSGQFRVRGLTAHPHLPKALWLRSQGVDVMRGDNSKEMFLKAFDGAFGVFAITNYFEKGQTGYKEYMEGAYMAEAADEAGVKHVVRYSMEDTRLLIHPEPLEGEARPGFQLFDFDDNNGRGPYAAFVPHMDFKGEADAVYLARKFTVSFLKSSFNFHDFLNFGPKRDENGDLSLSLPLGNAILPLVHPHDIGGAAAEMFALALAGTPHHGESVGPVLLTGKQIAQAFTQALGEKVTYKDISISDFGKQNIHRAAEYGNMLGFFAQFDFLASQRDTTKWKMNRPIFEYRCLFGDPHRFIYWLKLNKAAFQEKIGA